jgi:hypothetical protein
MTLQNILIGIVLFAQIIIWIALGYLITKFLNEKD